MAWRSPRFSFPFEYAETGKSPVGSLPVNEHCFTRKQHKCGKMYGASKSCFIACPTDDDLEPILELMSEKLSKVGIEPIIAVKERAYGQDIFCTKICGKIVESRFCVVILNDSVRSGVNIPNPNVYYEYGLMTALRKHIVPLQRQDLELAFNIQSYDTVKYSPKNVATELDRAIRDAIKLTESNGTQKPGESVSDKLILRRLEMAGFQEKDEKWFLSDVIEDTAFRGFGHEDRGFYSYVGKIDGIEDTQTYLDDLAVVIYRTDKKAKELEDEIANLKKRKKEPAKDEAEVRRELSPGVVQTRLARVYLSSELERGIRTAEGKWELMSTIYFAFVVKTQLDVSDFVKAASAMVLGHDRYKITSSQDSKIVFGDVTVDLSVTQH
jgi:hypothetical protein